MVGATLAVALGRVWPVLKLTPMLAPLAGKEVWGTSSQASYPSNDDGRTSSYNALERKMKQWQMNRVA